MKIRVVHAIPARQFKCELELPQGSRVEDAIRASGLLELWPDLARVQVGIYGRLVDKGDLLAEGDRVEFYRPLALEPKEARRLRLKSRGR